MAEHRSPQVIEIRTDTHGAATYRSLNLSGPEEQAGRPSDQVGNPQDWRGIEGLSDIKFHPPIQDQLVPGTAIFLAYAPAHANDPAELDQLDTLNNHFGPILGNFDWNNRAYLYSVVHQLPCTSSDGPVLMQASGEHARHAEPTQPIGPQAPQQPR